MQTAIPVALVVAAIAPASPHVVSDVVAVGAHDGWDASGPLSYAADGTRFVVEAANGPIVFDAKTGRVLRELHMARCTHASLSQHGDKLACGGKLVDVATGNVVDDQPDGLVRTTDGKIVLAETQLGVVLVAHGQRVALHVEPAPDPRLARLPPEIRAHVAPHMRPVREAWLTPDGSFALVRGADGVSIFRTKDGALVGTVAKDFAESNVAIGGHKLAVPAPSAIVIFDVAHAREDKRVALGRFTGRMAMSPDGNTLALVDNDTVSIVDVASGEMLRTLTVKHVSPQYIAVAPGGRVVAMSDFGNEPVRRFDVMSGKELAIDDRHASPVTNAALAPDGDRFATVAADGVRVWNDEGALVHFEPGVGGSVSMPDAHHVVVIGASAAVLSDESGAWTLRGESGDACCTGAVVAGDGKSAWMRSRSFELERMDTATGAVLAHAALARPSFAESFDVDDAGRLFVGGTIGANQTAFYFGPESALKKIEIDTDPQTASSLHVSGDGAWFLVYEAAHAGYVVGSTATGKMRALAATSAVFVAHEPLIAVVQGDELRVVKPDGTIVATSTGAQNRHVLAADAKRVALADSGGRVVVMALPVAK